MANGAGNRTEAPPRGRLLRIGIAVAAIVAIDQLTKAWVAATRKDAPLDIIGNSVQIVLSRNGGSAFGRFQGMTTLLAVGAIVVVGPHRAGSAQRHGPAAPDRLHARARRRARQPHRSVLPRAGFLRGHVVDFIAVGRFPVFNVADSCITIGAIILVWGTLRAPAK